MQSYTDQNANVQGRQHNTTLISMDIEMVRELLDYEPSTGVFKWRYRSADFFPYPGSHRLWNARYAGTVVYRIDSHGYLIIKILGRIYRAHRVAWAHVFGEWPTHLIDHINRNKIDNRIANLRQATMSENLRNAAAHKDSASGIKGVSWNRRRQKWSAKISINYKTTYLGYFTEKDDAAAAYLAAAVENFGEFATDGR